MMTKLLSAISKVPPSGAARAAASVAIPVPAPGRFSITIVGPRARPIWAANKRARISGPPPGGDGTTILIVRAVLDHTAWPDSVPRMMAPAGIAPLSRRMLTSAISFIEVGMIGLMRGMAVLLSGPEMQVQIGHPQIGSIEPWNACPPMVWLPAWKDGQRLLLRGI